MNPSWWALTELMFSPTERWAQFIGNQEQTPHHHHTVIKVCLCGAPKRKNQFWYITTVHKKLKKQIITFNDAPSIFVPVHSWKSWVLWGFWNNFNMWFFDSGIYLFFSFEKPICLYYEQNKKYLAKISFVSSGLGTKASNMCNHSFYFKLFPK